MRLRVRALTPIEEEEGGEAPAAAAAAEERLLRERSRTRLESDTMSMSSGIEYGGGGRERDGREEEGRAEDKSKKNRQTTANERPQNRIIGGCCTAAWLAWVAVGVGGWGWVRGVVEEGREVGACPHPELSEQNERSRARVFIRKLGICVGPALHVSHTSWTSDTRAGKSEERRRGARSTSTRGSGVSVFMTVKRGVESTRQTNTRVEK